MYERGLRFFFGISDKRPDGRPWMRSNKFVDNSESDLCAYPCHFRYLPSVIEAQNTEHPAMKNKPIEYLVSASIGLSIPKQIGKLFHVMLDGVMANPFVFA